MQKRQKTTGSEQAATGSDTEGTEDEETRGSQDFRNEHTHTPVVKDEEASVLLDYLVTEDKQQGALAYTPRSRSSRNPKADELGDPVKPKEELGALAYTPRGPTATKASMDSPPPWLQPKREVPKLQARPELQARPKGSPPSLRQRVDESGPAFASEVDPSVSVYKSIERNVEAHLTAEWYSSRNQPPSQFNPEESSGAASVRREHRKFGLAQRRAATPAALVNRAGVAEPTSFNGNKKARRRQNQRDREALAAAGGGPAGGENPQEEKQEEAQPRTPPELLASLGPSQPSMAPPPEMLPGDLERAMIRSSRLQWVAPPRPGR
jgi:hypothetical protein